MGLLLSFSISILLINTVGIKSYGEYTYYLGLISLFSMIAIFGQDKTILKILTQLHSIKENENFKLILNKTLIRVLIFSISIVIAIYFTRILLSDILDINSYVLLCSLALIPLKSISSIYFSAIRALEKLSVYLCLELIIQKLLLIIFIIVIKELNWIKINTFQILFITLIIFIIIIVFSNYYVKEKLIFSHNKSSYNLEKINQNNISLYIFFMQSIHLINVNVDNILIEYFIDTKHITYYTICSKIVIISGFTLNAINVFLAPTIAKLFFKNKIKELQKKLTLVAKLNLGSGIISFIFILFLGKKILFLHDESMVNYYPVVLILLIGTTFHVFCGSVSYLMIMTKMEKVGTALIFISALINFSLNALLIPLYGIYGCAVATTLSVIFYNISSAYFINKKINVNPTIYSLIN